jgi:FkbM family methyltransferase
MKIFFLLNKKIKNYIKRNFFLFKFFFSLYINLPLIIKKIVLPHEKEYYILNHIIIKKNFRILDIGGGMGESIISFKNLNKYVLIDTFEPNYNNYKFCKKLESSYANLHVYNFAYGNSKIKKYLYIPLIDGFRIDNFSGLNISEINYNIKSNFPTNEIKYLKQRVKFKKNKIIYDLIKIDCETNGYDVVKNLSNNLCVTTVLMIEFSRDIKKIYLHLKKTNDYNCYFFKKDFLCELNLMDKIKHKNIKNVLFIPKQILINKSSS